METCESLDLCISNTLFDHADELLVTYWGIGSSPMAPISHRNFAQLDLCLIDSCWKDAITNVRSFRNAPRNSQNFLVVAKLAVSIPKTESRARRRRHDLSCLRDLDCAVQFSDAVKHWMDQLFNSHAIDCHDICSVDESLRDAFDHAANSVLSTKQYRSHKPWISSLSLSLIAKRDAARASGDHAEEMALSKQIKRQGSR